MPVSKREFSKMKDNELDQLTMAEGIILQLLKSKPNCYFSKTEIPITIFISPSLVSDVLDSLVRERKILEQKLCKEPYYIINPDILIKKKQNL